jgi:hypothetical protein
MDWKQVIAYQLQATRYYARARKYYDKGDYQNAAHWQRYAHETWLWSLIRSVGT